MHKRILFSVLNWGLGHAARSIPIIHGLLSTGYEVAIASDGAALKMLQHEFTNLTFYELPAYNVRYSKTRTSFNKVMLQQVPKLLQVIKNEHKIVAKIVDAGTFDLLISDNRYGAYHKKIRSIFIGHQLYLKFPDHLMVEKIMNRMHGNMLKKFNAIWLPDFENGPSLSGRLSSKYKGQYTPIGIQSRMTKTTVEQVYDICVILSGPEPQRSILEELLINQLKDRYESIAFISGKMDKAQLDIPWKNPHSKTFAFCHQQALNEIVNQSELIICRSGYTSLMDLIQLQKKAILVPTPGQTEQEYLAEYVKDKEWFFFMEQKQFDVEIAILESKKYLPPPFEKSINDWHALIG